MITLVSLANAAASQSGGSTFAQATLPEWIQLGLAVFALIIGGSLLNLILTIRERFPNLKVKNEKFVEGLLKGVNKQTERLNKEFAEMLRTSPEIPDNAFTYVRDLRQLLRGATGFIAHIRAEGPSAWPSAELGHAFSDWASTIEGMDQLLGDLFIEVTAASERHSWVALLDQYRRESWYIRREVDKLPGLKSAIEKEAKPFLKKI